MFFFVFFRIRFRITKCSARLEHEFSGIGEEDLPIWPMFAINMTLLVCACCSLRHLFVGDGAFAILGSCIASFNFSLNVESLFFFMVSVGILVRAIKNCSQEIGFACLRVLLWHEFEKVWIEIHGSK